MVHCHTTHVNDATQHMPTHRVVDHPGFTLPPITLTPITALHITCPCCVVGKVEGGATLVARLLLGHSSHERRVGHKAQFVQASATRTEATMAASSTARCVGAATKSCGEASVKNTKSFQYYSFLQELLPLFCVLLGLLSTVRAVQRYSITID